MGWSSSSAATDYEEVVNAPHKAQLSHELIGGAAAWEAMKAYENHVAANGKPDSHEKAKELLAGISGAFVDRIAETKGLDAVDGFERAHAKRKAQQQIDEQLTAEYS